MAAKADKSIRYDKDVKTRIATITFDRPDYLNAPTIAARRRYADLLHRAGIDDEVKVVVISCAGITSVSGASGPSGEIASTSRTVLGRSARAAARSAEKAR